MPSIALTDYSGLLEQLEAAYGEDSTGAQVSWKIEKIELTPISFYNSAHILDSAGLRLLTERRIKAECEKTKFAENERLRRLSAQEK